MNNAATIAEPRSPPRLERRRASAYHVDVGMHPAAIVERWRALARTSASLAFQGETWVSAWEETTGRAPDCVPLAVTIVDRRTARDVMALPLVRREIDGCKIIEFADGGGADFNAPILGADAPREKGEAETLWRTLRANLPAAEILRLTKMPLRIGDAPNPLALVAEVRGCRLAGNILCADGAWNRRLLGVVSHDLCEIETALNWRGARRIAIARAKAALKSSPRLMAIFHRGRSGAH